MDKNRENDMGTGDILGLCRDCNAVGACSFQAVGVPLEHCIRMIPINNG